MYTFKFIAIKLHCAVKVCASVRILWRATVALGLELERDENGTKGKVGARVTGNPALSTY